jgi:hypothetical protein
MASSVSFFTVQQQHAEAYIGPDVGLYHQRISILHTVRNIIGHVGSKQQVEMHFKILIGAEVVLQEQTERDPSIGRPA